MSCPDRTSLQRDRACIASSRINATEVNQLELLLILFLGKPLWMWLLFILLVVALLAFFVSS